MKIRLTADIEEWALPLEIYFGRKLFAIRVLIVELVFDWDTSRQSHVIIMDEWGYE